MNDTEIAKAKRDFELKKAAYDVEVQTKVILYHFQTPEHEKIWFATILRKLPRKISGTISLRKSSVLTKLGLNLRGRKVQLGPGKHLFGK